MSSKSFNATRRSHVSALQLLYLLLLAIFWGARGLVAQESAGTFPEIYNSEPLTEELLTADEALDSLQLPKEFSATLFAAEPLVQNPIAGTVDGLGRVWIAENYTYAERSQRFDLNLRDRVIVLEDVDGDGVAEKRTVFSDSLQMLTGIVVGQGGVWLMCPPQLLFVPDANNDLVPDGPPQLKLDGFYVARENYHNFANGLSWGPDSWLYGRCGASCAGELGLPGTAEDQRVPLRGGIWRFHPQRQVVEVLNQGTTNPWGHDWNALGELFFINTVNGHLWHSIVGAHYVRPHSLDANPLSYDLIDMHADHWHFDTGKSWTDSRAGAANDFGGGHAHVGMMIYQEPTWPKEYQQRLMTINMHGRRVNVERLDREGSGYVARHQPDFALSDDKWFRGMELLPLPDGNVLLLDWSDTGECHDSTGVHRTSGRIFKIVATGRSSDSSNFRLAMESDAPIQLAKLQAEGSEFYARRARERLRTLKVLEQQNNPAASSLAAAVVELENQLRSDSSPAKRLRALWALWGLEALTQEFLLVLCEDRSAELRSWAIRLLTDAWVLDTTTGKRAPSALRWQESDAVVIAKLIAMAVSELDPSVRLSLASSLQRLPIDQRFAVAAALMTHGEDAEDHNLPLMVWYGLIPLGHSLKDVDIAWTAADAMPVELAQLVDLAGKSTWPKTRRLIARRLAEQMEIVPQGLELLIAVAIETKNGALAADIVQGAAAGLAGRRKTTMPQGWEALQALIQMRSQSEAEISPLVQQAMDDLNVLFGDGVTIDALKRLALDGEASLDRRRAALASLVDSRAEGLRDLCLQLLKQRYLNVVAARGLSTEADDEIGKQLLANYRSFAPLDRPTVISILASRRTWGMQLLNAVATGQIDRIEITPFQARQLSSFHDEQVDEMLTQHWGQARESDAERAEQMRSLRKLLTIDKLATADPIKGRGLFDKSCAGCHTLYGAGGKLAPDLTGTGRANIDYLIENIVDPSAVVTREFRTTVVLLEDGRALTGLMTSRSDDVVTLATQEEVVRIAAAEIAELKQLSTSTMPDGLLNQLSEQQVLDLIAYLQSTHQVGRP